MHQSINFYDFLAVIKLNPLFGLIFFVFIIITFVGTYYACQPPKTKKCFPKQNHKDIEQQDNEEKQDPSLPNKKDSKSTSSSSEANKKKGEGKPARGRPRAKNSKKELKADSSSEREKLIHPKVIYHRKRKKIGITLPIELKSEKPYVCIKGKDICFEFEEEEKEIFFPIDPIQNGKSIPESLKVGWDGKRKTISLFNEEKYISFKTRKDWDGNGLKQKPTSGYFLVFASKEWKRIDEPPCEEEDSEYPNFFIHYFIFEDKKGEYGFCTHEGEKKEKKHLSWEDGFSLKGDRYSDDSSMGDIFLQTPPDISCTPSSKWNSITGVVVGDEEGRGEKCWIKSFPPSPKVLSRALEDKLAGWFFIRFYDDSGLVDSIDFRFMQNLKKIRISEDSLISSEQQHTPSIIEFIGNCKVEWNGEKSRAFDIEIDEKKGYTKAIIPSQPDLDWTKWYLVDEINNSKIDMEIVLPRIWWAIGESQETCDWKNSLIPMYQEQITYSTKEKLYIRLKKDVPTQELKCIPKHKKSYIIKKNTSAKEIQVILSNDYDKQFWKNPYNLKQLSLSEPFVYTNMPLRSVCDDIGDNKDSNLRLCLQISHNDEPIPMVSISPSKPRVLSPQTSSRGSNSSKKINQKFKAKKNNAMHSVGFSRELKETTKDTKLIQGFKIELNPQKNKINSMKVIAQIKASKHKNRKGNTNE